MKVDIGHRDMPIADYVARMCRHERDDVGRILGRYVTLVPDAEV